MSSIRRERFTGQHSLADTEPLTTIWLASCLPSIRFPLGVVMAYKTPQLLNSYLLLPNELDCCHSFSEKRLLDFQLGRACASDVLIELEITNFPLLVGSSREPIWPDGVVGSISHSNNLAICAVSSASHLTSIGIDIEMINDESFDLLSHVVNDEELRDPKMFIENCDYLAKLIFSVKESVFKCQFPLSGLFLDFKDITLKLDLDKKVYVTTIAYENDLLRIQGAWDVNDEYIVSSAWINQT